MVVRENTLARGVHQFFVTDGQKFPLSDGADALNLLGRDVDMLVGLQAHFRLAYSANEPPQYNDGNDNAYSNQNGLSVFYFVENMLVHHTQSLNFSILQFLKLRLIMSVTVRFLRKAIVMFSSR